MSWVLENVRGAGGYLLGRGTYEMFAAHRPNAPEEQQMLAEPLNTLPKYVASATLAEPLEWQNSPSASSTRGGSPSSRLRSRRSFDPWKDRRERSQAARTRPEGPPSSSTS
jgi:hypothetical protein